MAYTKLSDVVSLKKENGKQTLLIDDAWSFVVPSGVKIETDKEVESGISGGIDLSGSEKLLVLTKGKNSEGKPLFDLRMQRHFDMAGEFYEIDDLRYDNRDQSGAGDVSQKEILIDEGNFFVDVVLSNTWLFGTQVEIRVRGEGLEPTDFELWAKGVSDDEWDTIQSLFLEIARSIKLEKKLKTAISRVKNSNGFLIDGDVLKKYTGSDSCIIVPDGIREISGHAFYENSALHYVDLPDSVEYIGDYAFSRSYIREINIPDSVTAIGDRVFEQCSQLRKAKISKNLKFCGDYLFMECPVLEEVSFPKGYNQVAFSMFSDCLNLKHITIPNGVIGIEFFGFNKCRELEELVLPNSTKIISSCSFTSCDKLSYLYIPASVKEIKTNIMEDSPFGKNVVVHCPGGSFIENYCKENNIKYIVDENPKKISAPKIKFGSVKAGTVDDSIMDVQNTVGSLFGGLFGEGGLFTPVDDEDDDADWFSFESHFNFLDELPVTFSIEGTGYEGRNNRIEYVSVGDRLILEPQFDNDFYFGGYAVEVFNSNHETLGYLANCDERYVRGIAENIDNLVARVIGVTPLSQRRANAKYALMDIQISLNNGLSYEERQKLQEAQEVLDNIKESVSDLKDSFEEIGEGINQLAEGQKKLEESRQAREEVQKEKIASRGSDRNSLITVMYATLLVEESVGNPNKTQKDFCDCYEEDFPKMPRKELFALKKDVAKMMKDSSFVEEQEKTFRQYSFDDRCDLMAIGTFNMSLDDDPNKAKEFAVEQTKKWFSDDEMEMVIKAIDDKIEDTRANIAEQLAAYNEDWLDFEKSKPLLRVQLSKYAECDESSPFDYQASEFVMSVKLNYGYINAGIIPLMPWFWGVSIIDIWNAAIENVIYSDDCPENMTNKNAVESARKVLLKKYASSIELDAEVEDTSIPTKKEIKYEDPSNSEIKEDGLTDTKPTKESDNISQSTSQKVQKSKKAAIVFLLMATVIIICCIWFYVIPTMNYNSAKMALYNNDYYLAVQKIENSSGNDKEALKEKAYDGLYNEVLDVFNSGTLDSRFKPKELAEKLILLGDYKDSTKYAACIIKFLYEQYKFDNEFSINNQKIEDVNDQYKEYFDDEMYYNLFYVGTWEPFEDSTNSSIRWCNYKTASNIVYKTSEYVEDKERESLNSLNVIKQYPDKAASDWILYKKIK